MDPLSMVAALGSPLGDLAGSAIQAHYNRKSAAKQMAFQENMSNTAYQRSAKDLEAAGLNRVIALGSAASSPSGSAPTIEAPKLGSSFSSARAIHSQVQLNEELAKKAHADTAKSVQEARATEVGSLAMLERLPYELNELFQRSQVASMSSAKEGVAIPYVAPRAVADIAHVVASGDKAKADARSANVTARAAEGLLPTVNNVRAGTNLLNDIGGFLGRLLGQAHLGIESSVRNVARRTAKWQLESQEAVRRNPGKALKDYELNR